MMCRLATNIKRVLLLLIAAILFPQGSGIALAQPLLPQTPTTLPSSTSWINVRDYGARGDGKADDGPAIRAAMAAASARGGTVYFPHGIYRGSVGPNPENAAYRAVGILPSRVRVIGDGMGSTVVGLLPDQPQSAYVFLNTHIGTGGDEDISLEELTVDGFAADQHPQFSQNGLGVLRMRHLTCRHVRFRNVYGTASSGIGESFHAEFGLSTDALFEGCEVVGSAGTTASGFSADASTDITYIGCQAYGMKVSAGFTHNACSHVTYIGCHTFLNPGGFNSEVSHHVIYTGCTAGGRSTNSPAYPYPANTPLGNTGQYGQFIINGDSDVLLEGCDASEGASGVWVQNASRVRISGGDYSRNQNHGIHIDAASLSTTRIAGHPIVTANGKAALDLPRGSSPLEGPLSSPPVPPSGTELKSPFPMDVTVYIIGGKLGGVTLDNVRLGAVSGPVRLPAGHSIRITYTAAPKWVWIAD